MSTEPTPTEESPDDPATKRFVISLIKISEMRLRSELKPPSEQGINDLIKRAISEFSGELESARREREREETRKKSDRFHKWFIQGFVWVSSTALALVFFGLVSQCNGNIERINDRINDRISTLESKEAKTK